MSNAATEAGGGAVVLTFPIQAAGAEALKISLALLMPGIWSELPGICLGHMVHDEILMEAPEALAEGRVRAEDPRGTGLATRISGISGNIYEIGFNKRK